MSPEHRAQVEAYDTQIVDLDNSIAETDAQIETDTNTKTDTEGEHTATLESCAGEELVHISRDQLTLSALTRTTIARCTCSLHRSDSAILQPFITHIPTCRQICHFAELRRYLSKIKPNCDWIEGAFTKRAEVPFWKECR